MTLPASPNTTYVAGSTPAIKAQDLNDIQAAIVALYARASRDDFGDGSDGIVTIDGTNNVPWASRAGATYTLNRDVFCNLLIVAPGVTGLEMKAFRIYCQDTFQVTATLASFIKPTGSAIDGNVTGGGFADPNTVAGSASGGGADGAGNGTAGGSVTNALGGLGGGGGGVSGKTPGAGGTRTAPPAARGSLRSYSAPTFGAFAGGGQLVLANGGSGGGGGCVVGGVGGASGGGAGGGVVAIAARNIAIANAASLIARGGNGASGTVGDFGGGGGGGGGVIILASQTLTVSSGALSGAANCPGGAGGAGFGTGAAGVAGGAGTVQLIALT